MKNDFDVIVIGGGPAGSTAAAFLAEKGHKVLVLEKSKFPRYHIGESLMPYCYFTLERLGVLEQIKTAGYTEKKSVQFVRTNGEVSQPFYFFQHFDHPASTTWQVPRDEFDQILLNNARDKGATVMEETTVTEVLTEGDAVYGVQAKSKDGKTMEWHARMTIDASGMSAFYSGKKRWKTKDPELKKIAIWTYYKGAKRDPGLDEGATTIAYIDGKGWFWNIPMADDIVSAGVVADIDYLYRNTRDLETIFQTEIKGNKWMEDHLSCGTPSGDYKVCADYSYRSRHCAGDGILLCGDAFGFLDPVFSSGVFLALFSGDIGAQAIHKALDTGDYTAAQFDDYGKQFSHGLETMRKIVYAFYDENFSFGKLMKTHMHLRPKLTDCLIGNLYSQDYTDLFEAIDEVRGIKMA